MAYKRGILLLVISILAAELCFAATVSSTQLSVAPFLQRARMYLGKEHYPQAFHYCKRALQVDPQHLGANQTMGELYLVNKNLDMAEAHLAMLKALCKGKCKEYRELKKKIDTIKKT